MKIPLAFDIGTQAFTVGGDGCAIFYTCAGEASICGAEAARNPVAFKSF